MNGHNPMRWNCSDRGCFNVKRRPKIEVFHDCFPRRISFGDVDGIVEINGKALLLEWKSEPKPLPTGQRIMYERITKTGDLSVIIGCGDAETMETLQMQTVFMGKFSEVKQAALEDLKAAMRRWVSYASKNNSLRIAA